MKWIRWAIDIIKQLWEKWTDFLDMYTIEEKIQELQESKKELFNTVLEGQESRSNLSVDDIKEILGVE